MMYCPRPQARAPLLTSTSTLSLFPWDPALFTGLPSRSLHRALNGSQQLSKALNGQLASPWRYLGGAVVVVPSDK